MCTPEGFRSVRTFSTLSEGPLGQDVGRGFVHICICTYSRACICTWVFVSVYTHVDIHVYSKHSLQPS